MGGEEGARKKENGVGLAKEGIRTAGISKIQFSKHLFGFK